MCVHYLITNGLYFQYDLEEVPGWLSGRKENQHCRSLNNKTAQISCCFNANANIISNDKFSMSIFATVRILQLACFSFYQKKKERGIIS